MKSAKITCNFCGEDNQSDNGSFEDCPDMIGIVLGITTKAGGSFEAESNLVQADIHICGTCEDKLRLLFNKRSIESPDRIAQGVDFIYAERMLQIFNKHYTAEHDDEHRKGELTQAAVFYTQVYTRNNPRSMSQWPFENPPSVPESRIEELAKAGALVAAEIDRLMRLEKADGCEDRPCGDPEGDE